MEPSIHLLSRVSRTFALPIQQLPMNSYRIELFGLR
jgi:hypothetical protein